jgi:(1->4)-alpha-D-glucan 1-alpha-D-glucosylmutase
VPGPNEEYLLYQTLVGAWPVGAERLTAYVVKAAREAKVWTSWVNPNARYEAALTRFAETVVDPRRSRQFLRDLGLFHARIAHFGALASLSQTLIKITAPGVPDFYQGTELWELALVDPDNRRPVDFPLRRRLLDELIREIEANRDLAPLARHLVETKGDGRVKMFLIRQALLFRRRHRALFGGGAYLPVDSTGSFADHVCAFARAGGEGTALVVVPRLLARRGIEDLPLGETYWETTQLTLPPALGVRFRDVFTGNTVDAEPGPTGATISVGRALADFPVALLERLP